MRNPRQSLNDSILGMSLREHIGGRFAIPWLAIFISLPLNIFSTIATNATPTSDGTVFEWLVISLTGVAAMLLVFLLAQFTLFRHVRSRPVSVWLVALIGGISGVMRLPAMGLAMEFFDVPAVSSSVQTGRLISSAILGIVLLPLAAFVTSTVYQYRSQRAALVASEVSLQQARMRSEGATAVLREVFISRVENDLTSAIDDFSRDSINVQQALQRTGRELWMPIVSRDTPRFTWRQALDASLRSNPLPTTLVLLIWIPSAVMSFTSFLGWTETFLRITTSALAIAVIFEFGRYWIRRRGGSSTTVLVTVLLGCWIVTSPVLWWLWSDRQLDEAFATMIANAVWLIIITVLSGMGITALRSSESILDDLRGMVSEAEIQALAADEELTIVRRELGALLHGPVRSRLNTASAVLEGVHGANRQDVGDALHAALQSLRDVAQSEFNGLELLNEITNVLNPWSPLLEIELSCPPLSTNLARAAAIVTEEAVANAYRHGDAARVQVTITGSPSSIHIVVEDNGTGLAPDCQAGLGTQLFDQHAPGRWSSNSVPSGGTRLKLSLAHDQMKAAQ